MTTLVHSGVATPATPTEKKEDTFKNTQITYELYPTLKIKTDAFLSFEEIVEELGKGRNKVAETSKLKVKGMPLDDLPNYFNRITDKIKEFVDSINQKIIDNKLSVEYTESNASKPQQKDKIIEEHQGLINAKINDLLVKSFKKKMRKQPNCSDNKKLKKGVSILTPFTNSSELNKKIHSELEKCFSFLVSLLTDYCSEMGWTNVSLSTDMLFKKEEVQKQSTQPYQQQSYQPQQYQQQPQQPQQYQPQQYQQQPQQPQQQTRAERVSSLMKNLGLAKGGGKSKKNHQNKNSKKQKRILTKKLSRKSNSRYMKVLKNKK